MSDKINLIEGGLEALIKMLAVAVVDEIERRDEERRMKREILSDMPDVLSRDQVAAELGISKRHVINLEKAGKIERAEIVGKKSLYRKTAVVAMIRKHYPNLIQKFQNQ
jgi:hypothetical protein